MSRYNDRERSPRRNDDSRNDRFGGEERRRRAPMQYDYPKFNDEKPKIINQLSEDALYKQSSRKPRSDFRPRNSDFRPRQFGDGRRFNDRNEYSRDRNSRDNYRRDGRSDYDRRGDQVKRYDDRSAFKINDVFSAPRSSYYFEHDNRDEVAHDRSPRRDRSDSRRHDNYGYKNSGFDDRSSARNSNRDSSHKYDSHERKNRVDDPWKHDMFDKADNGQDDNQYDKQDDRRNNNNRRSRSRS